MRARWSELILDEWQHSLERARPDIAAARLQHTRDMMNRAVEDAVVGGFEPLMAGLSLPDPDDRHVVAAAVASGAQVIVTFNLRDFPTATLEPLGIEAMHPDAFVRDAIDLDPADVLRIMHEQAGALRKPPLTVAQLLERLERDGLPQSVARIRALLDLR